MDFYCLKEHRYYSIPDRKIRFQIVKGKHGKRKIARAVCPKGHKVAKFVKRG